MGYYSTSDIYELDRVIDRADYCSPDEAEANIQVAWAKVLQTFLGCMLPNGRPVGGMEPREALTHLNEECKRIYVLLSSEVVAAWSDDRAARVPNFAALADGAAGARNGPVADAPAASLRRMGF